MRLWLAASRSEFMEKVKDYGARGRSKLLKIFARGIFP
jgi:hypothetical protein